MSLSFWSLIGFILSLLFTAGAIKIFPALGLLDFPERYGLRRAKIPYPGGLILGILILGFLFFSPSFAPFTVPLLLLGGVSFWDDRKPIKSEIRLSLHLLLAYWVYLQGIRIDFIGNPWTPGQSIDLSLLPFLPAILTVGWIVVIQNALNWFDGIKGLAVGVSGIGFLTLGLFGLMTPELLWEQALPDFIQFSFYLSSVCAGAFLFFWRGKIILGDTGSQVLGFLLAVMSLVAGTKIAVTLLVLSLPILDAFMVVFRRIFWDKKSPFKGDQKHLHHNLSRKISEPKTALLLIFLSGVFGGIALFLSGIGKMIAFFLVALFVLGLHLWSLGLFPKKNR